MRVGRYAARKVVQIVSLPFYQSRIRSFRYESLEELVSFAFDEFYGLIRPLQIRSEVTGLLSFLEKVRPKVVLEVGTAWGGTLFLLTRVASSNAKVISIDLPGGAFGGGYRWWRIPLYRSFALPGQILQLVRADSHNQRTLERVRGFLGGDKVDFLFIDGDHTYKGVKEDFEMYSPLVREGGFVALHDIVEHPLETGCEASKFWRELKLKYEFREIVEDWQQKRCGIGLIHLR